MADYIGIGKPVLARGASAADYKIGPYATTQAALTAIPQSFRYIGMTVIVVTNNVPKEYWFQGGVADANLVEKTSGTASAGTLNTTYEGDNLPTQSSESLGGAVQLHKISKTGNYNDLNNKPTIISDKSYTAGNGMGRKFVSKNTPLSDQMTQTNTIYVIQDDISIANGVVEVPADSILEFDGGSIAGGTLVGNNTSIKAGLVKIFDPAITLEGTWNVAEAYPEWFGAGLGNIVGYGEEGVALTNDTVAIQAAVDAFNYVKLSKLYTISTVVVPQFHTVENSTTYVLDGDGYKMQMKSVLKGGVIEVNSSSRYFVDTVNHVLVTSNSVTAKTESITTSNTMTVGTTQYYYKEITVASGNIVRLSDDDTSGYLFAYEDGAWVAQAWRTITSDSSSFKVRLARLKTAGAGYVYYDLVTDKTQIQSDFRDYNTFIKYVPSAITIADEPSNSRRVIIENIKITTGDIYDSNSNKVAGGAKDSYICAGIKTESEIISTKWNCFFMFTDVDIYGLFYGIVGNLRGCRFDVSLEQCYDNIDIYGGMNIFNLLGQTGVMLNLGTQSNPVFPYEYFIYLDGSGNVINDGIYDIGSKVRNHRYLIKAKNRNVVNSFLNTNYSNILADKTNGDYRSDLNYTWLGSHKHDYKQDGIQYTVTLTNGTYVKGGTTTSDVSSLNLLNLPSYIDFTPTGTYNPSTDTYSDTMTMTFFFEKVKNPFGVTAFAQSNGSNFQNMKIYYSKTTYLVGKTVLVNGDSRVITSSTEIANGSTITVNPGTTSEATYTVDGVDTIFANGNLYVYSLVANVKQGGYPTLDWNADYYQYRDFNQENMRVVLTSNKVVRWFGMCVYTKTNQSLISGSTANRPVKGLYVGQSYFDTDLTPARPVFWNGSSWSDLISTVELPTHQYIDYFDPDAGLDYHPVTNGTVGVNVTVNCYPDGRFESVGSTTSGGGRYTKLSEVFTIPAGGIYTLTREIVDGSVEGMMPYLVDNVSGDNVTNFDVGRKTLDTTGWESDKTCYIGINYESGKTYDNTIRLRVATLATFNLDSVIGDILFRLNQLEGN